MPNETNTPRTDAELRSYRSKNWKEKSPHEMLCIFARQLELETVQLKQELEERRTIMAAMTRAFGSGCCGLSNEELLSKVETIIKDYDTFKHQLTSLQAERDELKFAPGYTKVGIMAIIVYEGKVLLGKKGRAVSPEFVGKWVAPGGRVNYGETLESAVVRECQEECGIQVAILHQLPTQQIVAGQFHFVFPTFLCSPCSSDIKAGDDLSEVRWFTFDEALQQELTPITRQAIDAARDNKQKNSQSYYALNLCPPTLTSN